MSNNQTEQEYPEMPQAETADNKDQEHCYYRIRFRKEGQEFTVASTLVDLVNKDQVMVETDHGPEPAVVVARAAGAIDTDIDRPVSFQLLRRTTTEEESSYSRLPDLEQEAFVICKKQIDFLGLPMNLVRVERFFNGSKIIFYFTADSRVDFRKLVKLLVQEFRTRVEMRQIGVRHETQMTGGLGACGRELCCSSFLKKFESVSIKMAKTQDLPLNPAKISGTCNRLLCCLTYEYDTYRTMKKGMPRIGKLIKFENRTYRILRQNSLLGTLVGVSQDGEERVFNEEEWRMAEQIVKPGTRKGQGKKRATTGKQIKKET